MIHHDEQRRNRRVLNKAHWQRPAPTKRQRVRYGVLPRLLLLHVAARLALAEQDEIGILPVEHRIRYDQPCRALHPQLDRVQPEPLIRQIVEPRAVWAHQRQHSVQRPQPRVHSETLASSLQADVARSGRQTIWTQPEHEQYIPADVFSPALRDMYARTVHSFNCEDSDAR